MDNPLSPFSLATRSRIFSNKAMQSKQKGTGIFSADSFKITSNCARCTKADTKKMVQCDTCNKWFHYCDLPCANLKLGSSPNKDAEWFCCECTARGYYSL